MSSEPLAAEYAKSGKSACKGCQKNIGKGELRIGFIGKANFGATAWYHYVCVWTDYDNLKTVDGSKGARAVVQGYSDLKSDDKKKLDSDLSKSCLEAAGKTANSTEAKLPMVADYAKSAKSSCKGCLKPIEKGAFRVGFAGKANFGATAWYHYACIWSESESLRGINGSEPVEKVVEGFSQLNDGDKTALKGDLPLHFKAAVEKGPKSYLLNADYAKSAKSSCKECSKSIEKDKLRVGFIGKANFGVASTAWCHFECFEKLPKESFSGVHGTDALPSLVDGFDKLKKNDQEMVEKAVKRFCGSPVKRKTNG